MAGKCTKTQPLKCPIWSDDAQDARACPERSRRANAFSKERDYLEYQLTLAFAYDHFVMPHRGLRQRLPEPIQTKGPRASYKKWKPVTPAMAAGLTNHVWSMNELLSFRVPPNRIGERQIGLAPVTGTLPIF